MHPGPTASCNTRCTRPRGGSHSAAKASTWVRSPRLAAHVSSRLPPVELGDTIVRSGLRGRGPWSARGCTPVEIVSRSGQGRRAIRAVGSVSKRKRPWEQVPTLVRSGRRIRAMGIAGDRGAGCTGLRVQARGCIVRASRLTELRQCFRASCGTRSGKPDLRAMDPAAHDDALRRRHALHSHPRAKRGEACERSRASPGLRAVRTATSCDRERTSLRSRSGCGAVHVDGPLAVDGHPKMGSGPGRAGGCAGQARDPGIVGDGVGRPQRPPRS